MKEQLDNKQSDKGIWLHHHDFYLAHTKIQGAVVVIGWASSYFLVLYHCKASYPVMQTGLHFTVFKSDNYSECLLMISLDCINLPKGVSL